MNWFHVGLLVWCITTLISSIYLIKDHQIQYQQLSDYTKSRNVSYIDFLLTALLGYLCLLAGLAGTIMMIILLIIG